VTLKYHKNKLSSANFFEARVQNFTKTLSEQHCTDVCRQSRAVLHMMHMWICASPMSIINFSWHFFLKIANSSAKLPKNNTFIQKYNHRYR